MPPDPWTDELRLAPGGLRLRRPAWSDVAAVADLHAAAERARTGEVRTRTEDVRVRWLMLDGLEDVVLVEDVDAGHTLVGVGEYTTELDLLDEATVVHVEGQVHPAATGRGIATLLLDRADVRARDAATVEQAAAAVVRTTVVDGDDRARAWFTARGFVLVRHLLTMRLDLSEPAAAPSWPAGIATRRFRPGRDEERTWRAHQAAFGDVATHLPLTLEEWVEDRVLRDPAFDPSLTVLATDAAGEVVGLAVTRVGVEGAPEEGWIRDLGVVPAWRGRGLGMALLLDALHTFRTRGLTGAALDVDDVTIGAAVRLYERAGLRIVRRTDVVERLVATH
ncbi:GNAT family N-acetyltransferase [Nitriliruptor alkaliphilus]|uniref:GNAT family N-acetyltransferase n=1 Tax=Nitriliruptor alkaliphilus TaxID=427918 RepID=UPI000698083C|nr:GNAT family N-acetyltransferase [Nitriliruptor alkaliphilus]